MDVTRTEREQRIEHRLKISLAPAPFLPATSKERDLINASTAGIYPPPPPRLCYSHQARRGGVIHIKTIIRSCVPSQRGLARRGSTHSQTNAAWTGWCWQKLVFPTQLSRSGRIEWRVPLGPRRHEDSPTSAAARPAATKTRSHMEGDQHFESQASEAFV